MGRRSNSQALRIDGLLLLDKPAGLTSNQALQRVKRLLNARKAGHTGALDPAATGMLPLCFGEATKVCGFLLDADKVYRVTAKLGTATDTGDAEGSEIEQAPVPDYDAAQWAEILSEFEGESEQIPPMYSALKVDGKRLYELARRGQTVERKPRRITVHWIELLEAAGQRLVFRVGCSKGTYIRTLVEDIASSAGTVAHTAGLHRESVAGFESEPMLDLSTVEKLAADGGDALTSRLLPADAALGGLPAVSLTAEEGERFVMGQAISTDSEGLTGLARVYDRGQAFLGIGELNVNALLAPRKVFLQSEEKL